MTMSFGYQAIVKQPFADLVHPLEEGKAPCRILSIFEDSSKRSPRLGQLIFGEVVEVLGQQGELSLVRVPSQKLWVEHKGLVNKFWVETKALHKISAAALSKLPSPVEQQLDDWVVLVEPWALPKHSLMLSIGTRFKLIEEREDSFEVFAYFPRERHFRKISLPKQYAQRMPQDRVDKIATFVRLAIQLAQAEVKIPYVWGGLSIIARFPTISYVLQPACGSIDRAYTLVEQSEGPWSGTDCSGFIVRLAQSCGIPLLARNTFTMLKLLAPVKPLAQAADGDLIYLPGHVLVIVSVAKNLVVEASGPEFGPGCVQCAHVSKVLGVQSIAELVKKAAEGQKIDRLDLKGKSYARVKATILPLSRAFEVDQN